MRFIRRRCASVARWTNAVTMGVALDWMMRLRLLSRIGGIVCARRWWESSGWSWRPVLLVGRYLGRAAARWIVADMMGGRIIGVVVGGLRASGAGV
jgi:hypothetical protein